MLALGVAVTLSLLSGASSPLRAQTAASWFFFDRAVWSVDSRQVAVIGRFVSSSSPETYEDTLLVTVETGARTCVSPSMYEISLSKDRRRLAGRGRWGLYDHELTTAATRELIPQDPFDPGQIVTFAYTKSADALLTIRCDLSEPEISGVYRWPIDGSPAEKIFSDPECGSAALNFWQVQRREVPVSMSNAPTLARSVPIPGVEAEVLQQSRGGHSGLVVRQDGRDSLLCEDCRAAYVSSPPGGGRALVATAPESPSDAVGPGALWLIESGRALRRLDGNRHQKVVWSDSLVAYSVARPGRVMIVDAARATVTPLRLSSVPEWVRGAKTTTPEVWTLQVQDTPFADFEAARAEALRLKSAMGAQGFAIDPVVGAGAGLFLSVGSWPDSVAAAKQLPAVYQHRAAGAVGTPRVRRRPAAELQGNFDFGGVMSPDGKWRLSFRSHPHMFRPYLADEAWLEPTSGSGRKKLAVRALATF